MDDGVVGVGRPGSRAGRGLLPPGVDAPADLAARLAEVGYLADDGLATAAYLGLLLHRPLFCEGEAGVGKTELAKALAALLGAPLIRLQCYEGIDASQALYDWDFPRQLLHLRAAEAAGVILQIGFNRRFDRGFAAAHEAVTSGAIGSIQLMRSLTRDPGLANPAAVPPWTIFLQTLIHDFDTLLWLNPGADPVEVYATADALVAPDFKNAGLLDTARSSASSSIIRCRSYTQAPSATAAIAEETPSAP